MTILKHHTTLGALVDMCLKPYAHSLTQLERRCGICDKPGADTWVRGEWFCEGCDPSPVEDEQMGDQEYNRRQYERHGPDGGV